MTAVLWMCLVALTTAQDNNEDNRTIHLGFMGIYMNSPRAPPFGFDRLGSAFFIALDTIKMNNSILRNYNFTYTIANEGCLPKKGIEAGAHLIRDEKVDAVIGPVCSTVGVLTGYLGSYHNVPIIAYGGSSIELSNKEVSVKRLQLIFSAISLLLLNIFQKIQKFATVFGNQTRNGPGVCGLQGNHTWCGFLFCPSKSQR